MKKLSEELKRSFDSIIPTEEELLARAKQKKKQQRPWAKAALAACLAVVLLLGGLGLGNLFSGRQWPEPVPGEESENRYAFPADDYSRIATYLKATAAEDVEEGYLDHQYQFVSGAEDSWGSSLVTPTPEAPTGTVSNGSNDGRFETTPDKNHSFEREDYSDTNVQHQGVAEADVVKTDGSYLYYLNGGTLHILKAARPGEEKEKLVSFSLEKKLVDEKEQTFSLFSPEEMYLSGQYLVLICSEETGSYTVDEQLKRKFDSLKKEYTQHYNSMTDRPGTLEEYLESMGLSESLWNLRNGFDYRIYRDRSKSTVALILDVSRPEKPVVADRIGISGSKVSSRMVDGILYLVSTQKAPGDFDENKPESYVPTVINSEGESALSCDSILLHSAVSDKSYLTVLSYDVSKGKQADLLSVIGGGRDLYATAENLYVLGSCREISLNEAELRYSSAAMTYITRISLKEGMLSLASQTKVEGSFGNQFFFDEKEGCLRTVLKRSGFSYPVEPYESYSGTDYNQVYRKNGNLYCRADGKRELLNDTVLLVLDSSLRELSRLENLAPGEQLKSVRFDGTIAYFVTYLQVDPLFAVDLSDPKKPKLLSELKIPGFSEYLHPFGDDLLLGVGQDGSGRGKITLFDVSDKTRISEIATYTMEEKLVFDSAYPMHKQIFVDVEKKLVGLNCRRSNGISYSLFSVDRKEGISLFAEPGKESLGNFVSRGLSIGERFYCLASNGIRMVSMDTWKMLEQWSFPRKGEAPSLWEA